MYLLLDFSSHKDASTDISGTETKTFLIFQVVFQSEDREKVQLLGLDFLVGKSSFVNL